MAIEFFVVPMVGSGNRFDPFRAKYNSDSAITTMGTIRYSRDSSALLMLDATQPYLDFVAAQSDAFRICTEGDLSENIGGQAAVQLRNWLEDLNVPGNWLSASDSYREALRGIIGMFLFTQRHEGLNNSGFFTDLEDAGFNLNTQWQNLSQAFRDTMQATIDDHGWPIIPAANDQVRKLLKDFSEQFEGSPLVMANVEI